jgi:hypothetical protein
LVRFFGAPAYKEQAYGYGEDAGNRLKRLHLAIICKFAQNCKWQGF